LVGFDDAARGGQDGQPLVEACGADAALLTQVGERQRVDGIGERCCDALVDGAWRRCLGLAPINHLERQGVGPLGEFQRDGRHGGSCAVLDRESEIIAVAAEVEVGVAPGMELGGSSQGLAGPDVAGFLAWWTTSTAMAWRRAGFFSFDSVISSRALSL
jgi:hypothetical protein